MGLKQEEKKTTAVLTQTQKLPPLPDLALPTAFYLVSKLRAQTASFRKGWDLQSPVRHSAPRLTLDALMEECCNKHHFSSAKRRHCSF